jgi:hypothetical protein
LSPPSIDLANPIVVAPDATSVSGLKYPAGTAVTGTLVNVGPTGLASDPVSFHFSVTLPPVAPPIPEAPSLGTVDACTLPDPAPPVEVAPAAAVDPPPAQV